MKKILSVMMLALLLGAAVGCNEKDATKHSELADSAAIALGNLYGHGIAGQLAQQDSDFLTQRKDFLRGLDVVLNADTSKTQYINGMQAGMQVVTMLRNMDEQGLKLDKRKFVDAFKKAFMEDSLMNQMNLMTLQAEVSSLMERAMKEAKQNDPVLQKNKAAGEKYIKDVTAKEKYKKTPAGVYYQVLKEGAGENFKGADVVRVKYKGTHINGEVFDESGDTPVPMSLQGVVLGFQDMLMQMKPGMKVKCIIPADLAYGDEGNHGIEPGETLVFEIETLGLQEKVEQPKK